eukprot:CAMPEP_0201658088 /NCGR_PEP_ID=MMETSP0494-20130426/1107_1 /ASSEMBLY_ACC=CAM_ASM_000839 /TAXON_ID=420259 /ORGANISM="Thalassiosira gravida, Strain GMp14c1" /LENGTH=341 /DNA_ID=CAMNT_0048135035 /DNA_START=125 /DNA_END=1147 /DNA_ORIENTATION=+
MKISTLKCSAPVVAFAAKCSSFQSPGIFQSGILSLRKEPTFNKNHASVLAVSGLEEGPPIFPKEYQEPLVSNSTVAATSSSGPGDVTLSVHSRMSNKDSNSAPTFSTWKKRLNTRQDSYSLHKISSILFLISGFFIIGNGALCGFTEVQDYLVIPAYIFTISATITCGASAIMAWKYRSSEIAIRNGMINLAVVTTFISVMSLWTAHFCPTMFDIEWVSKGMVIFFTVPSIIGAVDGIVRGDEMVKNREDKNDTAGTSSYLLDWMRYVLPNFATVFFSGLLFWTNGINSSREVYLDCIRDSITTESDGFYTTVASAVIISLMVFFQTLRDKKLVTKSTEAW